jgi:repressor LexA
LLFAAGPMISLAPLPQLTDRQRQLIAYISRYQAAHGFPPSLRDMAEELGITYQGACSHVAALERKGAVQREPHRGRTITVV